MAGTVNGVTGENLWSVNVYWADGSYTHALVDERDLEGLDWDTWINNFVVKAATRPNWFTLGDLTFHSQNVRSIQLIETIQKED